MDELGEIQASSCRSQQKDFGSFINSRREEDTILHWLKNLISGNEINCHDP